MLDDNLLQGIKSSKVDIRYYGKCIGTGRESLEHLAVLFDPLRATAYREHNAEAIKTCASEGKKNLKAWLKLFLEICNI